MAVFRRDGRSVFVLLVLCVVVISVLQFETAGSGLVRWSGYSVLLPLVAAALLRFRRTLVVGALSLLATAGIYGFAVSGVSMGGRAVVVSAVLASFVVSLVVCKVRLEREERLTRVMITRDRLALMSEASERIGSTLNVERTAEELAEVAVPRFADYVTVDLFDAVLHGEEPPAELPDRPVALRRVAQRSVVPGLPEQPSAPSPERALEAGEAGETGAIDETDEPDGTRETTAATEAGRAEGTAKTEKTEETGKAGKTRDEAGKTRDEAGKTREQSADGPEVSLSTRSLAQGGSARARFLEGADLDHWLPADVRGAAPAHEDGGHSAILVPLRARGSLLGAALFLRHRRSDLFDSDDLVFAEGIGARAALCVDNARHYTRERETSLALQRSLLPRRLPKLAAVEVASRYLPAGYGIGVGGDWFDVIPLSGARAALVVGDVVGHGLHASATMARLRAAVRTLADMDLPPDELLTHLDDVVIQLRAERESGAGGPDDEDPEDGTGEIGATCLYAVYDPVTRRCVLARAAHLPPAVVMPDGNAELIDMPAGPPLGLGGWPFESVEVDLPEGSLLVLYTDGLIRSRSLDLDSGLQQLLKVLARPEAYLDATCEAALQAIRDDQPDDDATLLIARTHILDADHVATWDLPADPSIVAEARDRVTRQLAVWGVEEAAFTTELVVSELVTNAIRHARPPLQLRVILERGSLTCEVSDGSDTAPHLRRARTFDEGGRGLFIVAQLAERWGTRHGRDSKTIWAEQVVGEPSGQVVGAG